MSTTYKKFTIGGNKVQVESAIRDANGVRIDTHYAKQDGDYSKTGLKAYLADNLDSKVAKNDENAYLFRTAGGSLEIGEYCKVKGIIGGCIGFNQLFKPRTTAITEKGVTVTPNNDGSLTISGRNTESSPAYINLADASRIYINADNIYLTRDLGLQFSASEAFIYMSSPYKVFQNGEKIWKPTSSSNTGQGIYLVVTAGYTFTEPITIKPNLFDLTPMLGKNIADYIYNLGSSDLSSAWFRRYFPKDYYPYTPIGSFVNVMTSGKKYDGFNQWDEEWEVGGINATTGQNDDDDTVIRSKNYIKISPNTVYYFRISVSKRAYFFFYDAEMNFISRENGAYNQTFTTPSNAHFMRFRMRDGYGTTYNNDICINFHYDGERDGEYEPYKTHTVDLDTNWNSIGIPKIDENGNLYFEGNRYNYDGRVDEEYGLLVLDGSDDESYNSTTYQRFSTIVSDWTSPATSEKGELFCPRMTTYDKNNQNINDYAISGTDANAHSIYIRVTEEVDTVEKLRTWLASNPLYIVYKKNTITQSTATPFQLNQKVDNWGTEEFLPPDGDTRPVEVPVGHDTDYPINLRSKGEITPDLPDDDGIYVCKVESGTASYVGLATWLGANGYEKQVDLSSGVSTRTTGITIDTKKAYKIGNQVFLTFRLTNDSSATITANNEIALLSNDLYPIFSLVNVVGKYYNNAYSQAIVNINSSSGVVKTFTDLETGAYLYIAISYAIA